MASRRTRVLLVALLTVAPLGGAMGQSRTNAARAAVWRADVPGTEPALSALVARLARAAGYQVEMLDSTGLTNAAVLSPARFDLLVLPDARALPLEAAAPLEAFLGAGEDLLALGLPGWQNPVFRLGDRWLTRADYDRALARHAPARHLFEFSPEEMPRWTRAANNPASSARWESVADGGTPALHVVVENLTGWDTLGSPRLDQPFADGASLTCFRARGDASTGQLALEWVEADGARWIATVELTPQWQDYALAPEAFRPWEPPPGRGGSGDRLDVRKAVCFTVGLALTHTAVSLGRHEYWLAEVGTARNPLGEVPPPVNPRIPRWESFSPSYQCYPITTPVTIRSRSPLGAPESAARFFFPAGTAFLGLHPRPRGVGFDQDRPWRWEPLLGAYDAASGDYRGAVAALVVHLKPPFQGGVWALATPAEAGFYQSTAAQDWLRQLLGRMRAGVFLAEGGSEFFTVFPEQRVRLGARVLHHGQPTTGHPRLRLRVTDVGTGQSAFSQEWPLALSSHEVRAFETAWTPARWPAAGFRVETEVVEGGHVIDALEHDLNCWSSTAPPHFVEARGGRLWLGEKPWKAYGVNYMPSSGIGLMGDYFEYWVDRGAYDPEVIQRDLARIKALGMDAVSVFIHHRSLRAQHLLDFLRRCQGLGLHVNQSLRPGTPLDFQWDRMKDLIRYYRLAENDTVFAYDLAWEPSHYNQAYQEAHYAGPWRAWVLARHGSLATAVRAWGVPAPLVPLVPAGQPPTLECLNVPPMRQLTQDGPWRRLVADYRAFLDDWVGQHYAEARRLVRSIDSRHLVGFRMQHAGDPTLNWEELLPYDMRGLAGAVDLWEPEAYGRIGEWDRVRGGEFTAAYARLCDPAKPLVWAEMGYNVWDLNAGRPDPRKLEVAARFYADFHRMLRESGASGVFFWWYPGGFRANEQSDFGIINPDGTDRSITRVIRTEGPRFLAAPPVPAPNYWITVDREADARGLPGIYQAVQDEYWRAVEAGKTVGLRWKHP